MSPLLPIFPLDTVLLPGASLPLNIFEPRYRTLIADVRGDGPELPPDVGFGVVSVTHPDGLLEQSAAGRHQRNDDPGVGSGGRADELAAVGTFAAIVELEMLADGRSQLLTVGRRRFRILGIEQTDKPYLQAVVEWLPEVDGRASSALAEAARRYCAGYLTELADLVGRDRPGARFSRNLLTLSYQVAGRIRLGTAERQELLEAPDAGERLRLAVALLRREIVLMTRTRTVAVSPGLLQLDTRPN